MMGKRETLDPMRWLEGELQVDVAYHESELFPLLG